MSRIQVSQEFYDAMVHHVDTFLLRNRWTRKFQSDMDSAYCMGGEL